MLVLTRKTGQSIMIGDDIEVSVLAVSRDKIRIGITAPKEVPVFRTEVWVSIKDDEASGDEAKGKQSKEKGSKEKAGESAQDGIEEAIIDGAASQVEEALGRND